MTENHQRHLLVTLRHIDHLLSEAERVLASAGSSSPLATYAQLETPLQRQVLEGYVERVREGLGRALVDLRLPRPDPPCDALWAARGHIYQAVIAVSDIDAERMRSYGALSSPDAASIDSAVADIRVSLERLGSYLAHDREGGLHARLEKLETGHPRESEGRGRPASDEVALLRDLEGVISRNGLVQLRVPLSRLVDRLENRSFEIGIFGRVKSGKSSLLNYLLGTKVLPRGVTPVTAIPTRVRFGPRPKARIEMARGQALEVEIDRLADYSTEQHNPANAKHVSRIIVELPSPRLREGVTFVDTPGIGSLATNGARETGAYLPRCDLGLVLVDASSTLTQEDLMLLTALNESAVRVMMLVSKTDLLADGDLDRSLGYVRQQLAAQLRFPVPVHPISVAGEGAQLCDVWFQQELEPLIQSHREQLAASLKRKVLGLARAVVRTMETRQGTEAAEAARETALLALRAGDTVLQSAQREGTALVDQTTTLAGEAISAAALAMAHAWDKHAEPDGVLRPALVGVLSSHTARLVLSLEVCRHRLEQLLADAQAALNHPEEADPLPKPSSLPLFDPALITAGVSLPKPPVLPFFGPALLRRYALNRIQQPLQQPLTRFLGEYSQRLRPWLRESLLELTEAFNARAVPLRSQLEAGTTASVAESDADLQRLHEWLGT